MTTRGRPPKNGHKCEEKINNDGMLSKKDICDIIDLCKTSNVSTLKYRDLTVEFNKETVYPVITPTKEQKSKDALINNNEVIEQELELLKVEDPVEYERLAMEGELEFVDQGRRGSEQII